MIENTLFRPAYIAAPFAAWQGGYLPDGSRDRLLVFENVKRARLLAAYGFRKEGIAPVYVHEQIEAGVFGNDGNPEDRERGLLAAATIAEAVALAGGELWLLELPDGSFSRGCEHERAAFERAARTVGAGYTIRTFKALSCYPDGVICTGVEHFAPPYDHALGEPKPDLDAGVCPPGAAFAVKLVSVKFEIHAADGSIAVHEGPLANFREVVGRVTDETLRVLSNLLQAAENAPPDDANRYADREALALACEAARKLLGLAS